jgi:membrane protein DedA with SNARE-associated domain
MTHGAQFAVTHGAALLFTWILLQQAGLSIPSAPPLIAAGSLASSRRLGLASSFVAALSSSASGWILVPSRTGGWYKGARFRRANSNWKDRALSLIRGLSAVTLLLATFIAGSNRASLVAGQAGISAARFVIYDSIGSLTWSGGYIALGYLLHGQLHWTLAQTLRPLFIVRVAISLAKVWRRRSLAYVVLALAIVFFAVRPVSQHNAGKRMSADAWRNVRPTGSARPAWVWLHRGALGWEESANMHIQAESEFARTPVLENCVSFSYVQCGYCGYLILGGSAKELLHEEKRHAVECKATHDFIGVASLRSPRTEAPGSPGHSRSEFGPAVGIAIARWL